MKPSHNPFLIGSTLAVLFLSYTGVKAAGVWDGTTGNYDVATNWDNDAVPGAINVNVSNNGTVQITTNHTTNDILTGTVGTSTTSNWLQTAGTMTMGGGWFRMGTVANAGGAYNLNGGTLVTRGRINIGENNGLAGATAIMNVAGGTWNNNGATDMQHIVVGGNLAGDAVGKGVLNLSSGTINNSRELWVGMGHNTAATGSSNGTFNMSGGNFNSGAWTAIGRTNGTGVMNLSGGTFTKSAANTNATIVGASGAGTLNQNNGTLTVLGGETWVGENRAGTWTMSGGTANLLVFNVGQGGGGVGVLNMQNASSGVTGPLTNGGGTQVITAGAMLIGNNATATGTVNLDGGTLAVNTIGRSAGTGTLNLNGGKLQARTATATFVNNLTRANVRNSGALIDTQANIVTIPQALLHSNIGGDAAIDGGLNKIGTGELILSGANTFTGDTVITAGTLTTGSAGALGMSTLNYNNQGGTLSFGTQTATTFGGLKGAQNITLANTAAAAVALSVGANNTSTTYSGILSGGGSLLKYGTGTLTLTNSNTFTGNVTVNTGPLAITNSSALGDVATAKTIELGTSNGTAGNPQLRLDGSGGNIDLPATFTYSTSNAAGTIFNDAGNNSIAGQINMTLGGGATNIQSNAGTLTVSANITPVTGGRVLILQGAANGSISGVVADNGYGLAVTKNGAGTWTLSGSNSYTGATTVNAGVLQAGITDVAFGSNSPVVLANAAGAVLDLNGFNNTIGSLSGGGALGGTVTLGAATLTTGAIGNSTFGGVISGTGGLYKAGATTLTLTNANTYSGTTTVGEGTLLLDHSGANLGALGETAVTIATTGTLAAKGNATIGSTAAATVNSAGKISLQDGSINTLAAGGPAILTDSSLDFDLAGNGVTGSADQITTTGAAFVSGTTTINLNLIPGQTVATGSYNLVTAGGGLGSGGANFTIGAKPAGFYNYLLGSSTPTSVVLTITGNAPPAVAYWTGLGSTGTSDASNFWASGSGIAKSNWSITVNGLSDPLQVPAAATDVIFTAANAASVSGALDTTLDATYSIKSLTFNTSPQTSSPISSVQINTDANSLILGSGGLTVAAANNSSTTITSSGVGPVVLNGNQNWANQSNTQPLTVNTPVNGFSGATTLTLNGAGTGGVTLGGSIGNGAATSVGLVLGQAGTTTLSGDNTFTGGVTLSSGTVIVGNSGAFNSTAPNTLTFSAGSTGTLRLDGFNVTVASMATDTVVGSPVIEAGGFASTLTDNVAAGNTTFAGILQDGSGGSLSLTKTGAGALALTGANTYSGITAVNGGTLTLGSAEDPLISGPLGVPAVAANSITFGGGTLQYSAANQFDYSARFSTAANQQFKIDTNGQNISFGSALATTGGNIQKYGSGILTLTGTNTAGNFLGHGGTLVLNGTTTLTTTGYSSLGQATGETSIVNTAGSSQFSVTGDFNVSDLAGSKGVLNISDTAAVKGSVLYVGKLGNATGIVNQTGGSFALSTGGGDWRIGGGGGTGDAAAVGIYNISAGTFTAPGNFQVGAYGNGALNITGTGAVTQNGGFFALGRYSSGYGMMDVNGGSFTFNVAGNRAIIGETGSGVLNVRAGTFTTVSTSTTAGLTLGNDNTATSSGQANLTGGTLNTASIGKLGAAATATFNFNGGILQARAASATFMQGLTSTHVHAGGANIDANGFAITIGQPLLTPAGSDGLASVSVTSGGSGYATAPIVKITGGGGTGAAAVATVNPAGEITGIIVTNPGTGYTGAPDITLVTGIDGGSGAALSPVLAPNTSGALTVSSTTAGGVVTLTGASTFSGDATINTGTTLQLGNGTTGNDGTILSTTVANSGTLAFNRFGANTFGGTINGTGGVTKSGAGTQTLTATNTYTGVTTVNGGTLSVADIQNGGVNSNIGASTAAPANLVFGGNGILQYTGPNLVTDRGYTVGTGGGGIDHASTVTITGPVVSTATGSFTKNGTGTLNITNTIGTNALTGGNVGNGLGFVVNAGLVNLGGTAGSPLAQTNTIANELIIGTINNAASPAAEVDINGGTTTIGTYIGVGRGNGTNNAATTLTLNNNAQVTSGQFAIGYSNGVAGYTSSPTVNFKGSSIYTDSGVFVVGESVNGAGGVSTVNLNDSAAIFLTSLTATAINIGASGPAIVNQNGGSMITASPVTLARDATSTATYHLNGGGLTTTRIGKGSGNGTFNFNGGTLTAAGPSTIFIQSLTRANIRDLGAIINTAGWDVTTPQAFDHSNVGGDAAIDGGLTKQGAGTLTLTLPNTYTGETKVIGGTLATQSATSLSDTAALRLSAGTTLALNFAGTETVDSLYFGATQQASGVWGAIGSGAAHESASITGTGFLQVTNGTSSPFDTWAGTHGLTGPAAQQAADPDGDGYNNLAEFILGGEPNPANPGSNSNAIFPTVAPSGGNHVFSFRRSQQAMTQPGINVAYQYGSNLVGWTTAVHGVDGITITVTANGYASGIDKVDVSIPDSLAPVGTRFARLNATTP